MPSVIFAYLIRDLIRSLILSLIPWSDSRAISNASIH